MNTTPVVYSPLPNPKYIQYRPLSDWLNVRAGYFVQSYQVVGPRSTGWTAMTGKGSKAQLSASIAGSASKVYVRQELQAALDSIAALQARMKAYDEALHAHGLIGP